MDRKNFIKTGCNCCLMAAAGFALSSFDACGSIATSVYKTKIDKDKLLIPLQLLEQQSIQFVRPEGWQYDIAVRKQEDGNYLALLMQCTHMDYQLSLRQNSYVCSLHGSSFNLEGNVVKGPAEIVLKKYNTELTNSHLFIHI